MKRITDIIITVVGYAIAISIGLLIFRFVAEIGHSGLYDEIEDLHSEIEELNGRFDYIEDRLTDIDMVLENIADDVEIVVDEVINE